MFGRKNKKGNAEQREKRISETSEKLRAQILTIGRQKQVLVSKVVEAKRKGLTVQEKQARGLLGRCLAAEKRTNGMLMTLELAVQSRDLADLNRQFIEAIGDLSSEIDFSSDKTDVKGAEKKYLHAVYSAQKKTKELDEMLEVGDYAAAVEAEGSFEGFDEEIDSLITDAELASGGYKTKF